MVVLSLSFSIAQNLQDSKPSAQIFFSKSLYLVAIAAVMCLSLIAAAYVEVVGYPGIGLASLVAVKVVFGPG